MATVEEHTDPFVRTFTPVPSVGQGICEVCHSWTGTRYDGTRYRTCSSCGETTRSVRHSLMLVVPISLAIVSGQLYTVLDGYKNSPDASARDRLRLKTAALLARFLRDHGDCIRRAAGRDWTRVTSVPSSRARHGPHPLEQTIRMARAQRLLYESLLDWTEVRLGHRSADDLAYRVRRDVTGERVLLIDDTFTTGARVQSAASALALAGADVIAAVALGRIVRPSYSVEAAAFWERQRSTPFDFGVCCVEA